MGRELTLIQSTAVSEIRPLDGLAVVAADDLKLLHVALTKIRQLWATPLDVDETCKLALTTTKLLESRRKLMGYPHERIRDSNKENEYYSPYGHNE